MKKLYSIFFILFFNVYTYTAFTKQDPQIQFLNFIEQCFAGKYDKAFIKIDADNSYRYEAIFSAQDIQNNSVVQETRTVLSCDKKQPKFFELVTTHAGRGPKSTIDALNFITILMGKKSGKIEFNKDVIGIQE